MADNDEGITPGAFKDDEVVTIADAGWDGVRTYTNTHLAQMSLECIQKDIDGNDVDLDSRWVPSAILYLPPGAMVRYIGFYGGENAP